MLGEAGDFGLNNKKLLGLAAMQCAGTTKGITFHHCNRKSESCTMFGYGIARSPGSHDDDLKFLHGFPFGFY
jgi:hypothetical protein